MIKLKNLLKEDDATLAAAKPNIPHYRLYNCLVKKQGWKHVGGSLETPESGEYSVRYEKQFPEYSRSHTEDSGFFGTDTEKQNDRLILRLEATRENEDVEWVIHCKLSGIMTHEKTNASDNSPLSSYEGDPDAKNYFGKSTWGDNKSYFEQEFVFDGLGIKLDCAQLKQKIDQFLTKYQQFKK